jgi:hypothetical protein
VGDFNSTETLSTFDASGPLAPSCAKEVNVEVVQTLLSNWRFKDLWTREDNNSRETKKNLQEHLTHWNHEHTRGHHINRVYANFVIEVDKGHETLTGHFVKISAYANNTAVHLGLLTDITIYKLLLKCETILPCNRRNYQLPQIGSCNLQAIKEIPTRSWHQGGQGLQVPWIDHR